MTIYVDDIKEYLLVQHHDNQAKQVGARNGYKWAHMFADEADCYELHDFAKRIGMQFRWFQGDHYDLTPGRRAMAVRLGAVEVNQETAVRIWRAQGRRYRLKCKGCGYVISVPRCQTPPMLCPSCGRSVPQ